MTLGSKLFPRSQIVVSEQKPEARLPPFRYPSHLSQVIDMRGPNAITGFQSLYIVPQGHEFWVTHLTGSCHASNITDCVFGVQIFNDVGVFAQWITHHLVEKDDHDHFNMSWAWPIYIPENYTIYKWTSAAPAVASVGITGWVGKIPDPGKYFTRY